MAIRPNTPDMPQSQMQSTLVWSLGYNNIQGQRRQCGK